MTQTTHEKLSRKNFLEISIAVMAAVSSLVIGLPLVGSLIGSSLRTKTKSYTRVGSIDSLHNDTPTNINFADLEVDGFIRETVVRSVWALKKSDTDVTVLSPICPHLGCRYNWEAQSNHFVCPCHGSVFSKDGEVLAGPAPRPLDTLPTQIKNGDLYVAWEQFKPGSSQKEAI